MSEEKMREPMIYAAICGVMEAVAALPPFLLLPVAALPPVLLWLFALQASFYVPRV